MSFLGKTVTLHGGPLHGSTMQIPEHIREIDLVQPIYDPEAFRTEDQLGFLTVEPVDIFRARYTRVTYRDKPTDDFEWVGKVAS